MNPLRWLDTHEGYQQQHSEIYLMIMNNENISIHDRDIYDYQIHHQVNELNRLETQLTQKVDFNRETPINHDLFRIMSYQNKLLRYLCKKIKIRKPQR